MASNDGPLTTAAIRAELSALLASGVAHRDLGDRYRTVLESIMSGHLTESDLVEGLKVTNVVHSNLTCTKPNFFQAFIEAIVNENVSLVISRQLLTEVSSRLSKMKDDNVSKAVAHFTLGIVQPRVISFEDQVGAIRQHLADIYEREQDWRQAAQVLTGMNE